MARLTSNLGSKLARHARSETSVDGKRWLAAFEKVKRIRKQLLAAQAVERRERSMMIAGTRDIRLTSREKHYLRLIQNGLCNKEICVLERVSYRTVKYHVANLMGKFGVSSRHDL